MESFRVRMEARDPVQGRFRAYRIDAGTDLLGDWVVDITYGRIGSRGRTIRHVATTEAEAKKIVRHCLQRRATAPKRIGVGYQLRELDDPGQWFAFPLLQSSLPTLATNTAGPALPRLRLNSDRPTDVGPRRSNLPGQVEHPGPQLFGVFDLMPAPVAANYEAVQRANI